MLLIYKYLKYAFGFQGFDGRKNIPIDTRKYRARSQRGI